MTRCTADLEYFQCDLCRKYFHKDIFCPHRRACKGPDSQEMDTKDALALGRNFDVAQRRAADDSKSTMLIEEQQKRQREAIKTKIANEHAAIKAAQTTNRMKAVDQDAMMAFLNGAD